MSTPTVRTFLAYLEDKPGVLNRVTSLFRRRNFNIESLTVGRTERPDVSRMTLVVRADDDAARRLEAHLWKLVNVLAVDEVSHSPAIARELALAKVRAPEPVRAAVMQLCEVFRARVLDVTPEVLSVEITGTPDKVDGFLEVVRPYGLVEMVRTGVVAMRRGTGADNVVTVDSGATTSPAAA
jgi:acetolactate synthase-1/3 small subunit